MRRTNDGRAKLRELGFRVAPAFGTAKRSEVIRCPRCATAWSYPRAKPASPAVFLKLLDHKRGHEVRA